MGRVNILLEMSLMSTHMALPRIGHLEQVIHMFGNLKLHPKRKIAFDAVCPSIDERRFKKYNWYNFTAAQEKKYRWTVQNPLGN